MGPRRGKLKRFVVVAAFVAGLAGIAVSTAAALAFDDADPCRDTQPLFICPTGAVDATYSIQFKGHGGCGPDPNVPGSGLPYQYRIVNGALPGGLSLSKSGLLSGRPTGAGTSQFWVELSDEDPPSQSWCDPPKQAHREFSITVEPSLVLAQTPPTPGTVGAPYSFALAAGLKYTPDQVLPASSPLSWSVSAGGLPPGVVLGASDGMLSGTPTIAGSYQFTVQAVLDAQRLDLETFTINVAQPLVISSPFTSPKPPKSEVGVAFDATLTATGGNGTFTWTLAGGSLPTGVALAADGTISGTPRVSGRFPFTASVTDGEARVTTLNATLAVAAKLAVKTLLLRPAKVGKLYRAKLATLGGVLPTKWKILRGTLPRGIRFDKTLGVFLGTPRREGRYRVTVQVVDALGVKSQKTLTMFVTAK